MSRFREILGGVLVAGFLATLILLFWRAIPNQNEQLIVYMLGQLSGFVGGIVAYHYATTASAQQQRDTSDRAIEAVHEMAKSVPNAGGDTGAIREGDQVTLEKQP